MTAKRKRTLTAPDPKHVEKLRGQIIKSLSQRADVTVFTEAFLIIAAQTRRVWRKTTLNPDGFTPHTKEGWHYYAQSIVIDAAVSEDGLTPEQESTRTAMEMNNVIYIAPQRLADVLAVLEPAEPDWWAEYAISRAE